MIDGFKFGLINDVEFLPIMENDIKSGFHKNTAQNKTYFTDAYFHYSGEIAAELEESDFIVEDLIAVESFANMIPDIKVKIKDIQYLNTLLKTIKLVEREPTLLGVSSHYMGIAHK